MCPAQVTVFEEPVSHKHIRHQKQAIPTTMKPTWSLPCFFFLFLTSVCEQNNWSHCDIFMAVQASSDRNPFHYHLLDPSSLTCFLLPNSLRFPVSPVARCHTWKETWYLWFRVSLFHLPSRSIVTPSPGKDMSAILLMTDSDAVWAENTLCLFSLLQIVKTDFEV